MPDYKAQWGEPKASDLSIEELRALVHETASKAINETLPDIRKVAEEAAEANHIKQWETPCFRRRQTDKP